MESERTNVVMAITILIFPNVKLSLIGRHLLRVRVGITNTSVSFMGFIVSYTMVLLALKNKNTYQNTVQHITNTIT